ncbi:MAG: ATP-binding protein [Cyanobacteria bacterium P01_D01_bin.36]
MLCSESLAQIKPFDKLPIERLDWICDRAKTIHLAAGEVLVRQGDTSLGFFIQVSGKITVSQHTNGADMPVGHHESPSFFGEIQVLTEDLVPVTLTADIPTELYRLNCPDFLDLVHSCREFEKDIFQTVGKRLRGLESSIRTREKMAALGTLSAGLAHELNNPAAALVRVMQDIEPAMLELQRMNLVYGQRQPDEAHTKQWTDTRDSGFEAIAQPENDPLAQSDREDALTDWLEDYGVNDAWKLAEPLAAGCVAPSKLDTLIDRWRNDQTEMRDMGIRWLALSFDVMGMIRNGLDGAQRISELVKSMKAYSYMDQAAHQQVDIHDGIEDTLRLLAFKLKSGVKVERKYTHDLPKITAFGSELNQVWTNLLDNALDAMDEGIPNGKTPTIVIRTYQKNNEIVVEIEDNGPGIPTEIKNRILEPFFTTKPMGKGSGLGLDVVRRIVQNRHKGTLLVESRPGRTCFSIQLPR